MKIAVTILAAYLCIALVNSVPIADEGFESKALDRLMMVEADNESTLRSKRTIGLLRQLFPEVSKMIDDKVNMIVGEVFKIFGPVVIQSVLGGNKNIGNRTDSGTTINVKNPFDDDDNSNAKEGFQSFVDDDDFFTKPKVKDTNSKETVALPEFDAKEESKTTSAAITTARPTRMTTSTFTEEVSTTMSGENVSESTMQG